MKGMAEIGAGKERTLWGEKDVDKLGLFLRAQRNTPKSPGWGGETWSLERPLEGLLTLYPQVPLPTQGTPLRQLPFQY